jgi:hypothetical protein
VPISSLRLLATTKGNARGAFSGPVVGSQYFLQGRLADVPMLLKCFLHDLGYIGETYSTAKEKFYGYFIRGAKHRWIGPS